MFSIGRQTGLMYVQHDIGVDEIIEPLQEDGQDTETSEKARQRRCYPVNMG